MLQCSMVEKQYQCKAMSLENSTIAAEHSAIQKQPLPMAQYGNYLGISMCLLKNWLIEWHVNAC